MNDQHLDIVDSAVNKLAEHFDVVLVMVSSSEGGDTFKICRGRGNWYARSGMAHDFLDKVKDEEAAIEIAKQLRAGGESNY